MASANLRAHGYEVIDAHTHVHQTAREGQGFVRWLNESVGTTFPLSREGSVAECLRLMDSLGVAKTMIVPWMPAKRMLEQRLAVGEKRDPEIVRSQLAAEWSALNLWAAKTARERRDRFDALVGVDPVLFGADWAKQQFARCLPEGAMGLKMTPPFIGVAPDDDRLSVVWEEAHSKGLAVLNLATGRDPAAPSHPKRFEPVLKAFPRCKIVFAHMGLGAEEEVALLASRYQNIYCDTSSWLELVGEKGPWDPRATVSLFRRIGIDRILYGTNYPMMDPAHFLQTFMALPLTDDERRQVLSENYRRVYGGSRQRS